MRLIFAFLLLLSCNAIAADTYCEQSAKLARGAAENFGNQIPIDNVTSLVTTSWPIAHAIYPDIAQQDMLDLIKLVYARGWSPSEAYVTVFSSCQYEQEKQEAAVTQTDSAHP